MKTPILVLVAACAALAAGSFAIAQTRTRLSSPPTGANDPAAGWTSDGTTTSTTQGATVTNAAGLSATLFGNINATTTLDIVSSTNDATTSATVAAVTIRPTVNLTDGDLVLNVENSAGTNLLAVSEQGNIAIPLGQKLTWGLPASGNDLGYNNGSGFILRMGSGSTYLTMNETTGLFALPLAAGMTSLKYSLNSIPLAFSTAPTVTSACTSPTVTHGSATTAQFDVGTTCAGISTLVLALPAATNGWACDARHKTVASAATAYLECAGDTTTAITCTNFARTTGLALAFTDADDIVTTCFAR